MANTIDSFWNERWVKIVGKAPTQTRDYYFSDYGRLKSVERVSGTEKLLNGSKMIQGYLQINVKMLENCRHGYYVHKLVADAFVAKERPDQKFVVHMDGDNYNNHYENLKWMSQAEMTTYQISKGVYDPENRKRGTHCKMNPARVRLLKQRLREGKTKKKILAKSFDITVEQLRKIEKGIDWKYVKLEDE